MNKEKLGSLSKEELAELDRKQGNFYRIFLFGEEYKINHCFIARILLASVIIGVTIHIILIVHNDLSKKKH
jgi:hypothetical protein